MSLERILVVDDEESIREIVSSMLAAAKYQCRQAASASEALARLESGEEFDLLLTDLMMPGMDGTALLERSKERFPDMPVVMVTAVHDIKIALDAIRDGAYDYLTKPFEREQLLATVGRALENRRLKMENRQYQVDLEALVAERTRQLRETIAELKRSYDITLEVLGDALDYKDGETENHCRRVTAYTMAIARHMGLPKEQIEVIARGAFLHDVGKMAIPESILKKPGKLTSDEMAVMREHCYLGYKLVQKIPVLKEAAEIVYSHQERYDGTGYPRGLKGEEIPLGARIFAVVDTLDAITSDRDYRAAQSFEVARKEIRDWTGRQFDPDVVKAFLEIPESLWQELRRDIDAQSKSNTFDALRLPSLPQTAGAKASS